MGCCITKYETKVATFENVIHCRECSHDLLTHKSAASTFRSEMTLAESSTGTNYHDDVCDTCLERIQIRKLRNVQLERVNRGSLQTRNLQLQRVNRDVVPNQNSPGEPPRVSSKTRLLTNVLLAVKQQKSSTNAYFNMLTNAVFRLDDFEELHVKTRPVSLAAIHNNIWCAQANEITAFTQDLKPRAFVDLDEWRVKHKLMRDIQSLAEVSTGQIAVACGTGLHLLSKAGRYDGRINEDIYTDVSSSDGKLYGVLFGGITKAKVQVFDEKNDWNLLRTIKLPVDGLVTITVSEKWMCVCSSTNGAIYVIDFEGNIIKKCGCKGQIGTLGHFEYPRVCHGSQDGAALVIDKDKEDIQVLSNTGDWGRVAFEQKLSKPSCAVFVRRHLYVLQTEWPYTIYKYS